MDSVFTSMVIEDISLEEVLNFLPYPFLVSKNHNNTQYNIYTNSRFVEEIGYSCSEMPTINEWFEIAYPNLQYRTEIISEWNHRAEVAKAESKDHVVMQAKIHTKCFGDKWYEVKASLLGHFHLVAFVNIDKEINRELELQTLNENKNTTLSILSHDLRTPINNLYSILELINSGRLTKSEEKEMFQKLTNHVFQMREFVDTTLQWTKVNFGELTKVQQSVNIAQLVQTTLELYHVAISEKKIGVSKTLGQQGCPTGDPEIFSILLRNLISNAIKYTPTSGSIHVHDTSSNGRYKLSIENSGGGITGDKINSILHGNYVSEKGTQGETGTGLGLKLCQQLLTHMGGAMEIESRDDKTVFRITL